MSVDDYAVLIVNKDSQTYFRRGLRSLKPQKHTVVKDLTQQHPATYLRPISLSPSLPASLPIYLHYLHACLQGSSARHAGHRASHYPSTLDGFLVAGHGESPVVP